MKEEWIDTYADQNRRLYDAGYSMGGYVDNGVTKYVLYRVGNEFTKIHEFGSREERDNMIKLLLPPEG